MISAIIHSSKQINRVISFIKENGIGIFKFMGKKVQTLITDMYKQDNSS